MTLSPAKELVLGMWKLGNKIQEKMGVSKNFRTDISWLQEDQLSGTLVLQT